MSMRISRKLFHRMQMKKNAKQFESFHLKTAGPQWNN